MTPTLHSLDLTHDTSRWGYLSSTTRTSPSTAATIRGGLLGVYEKAWFFTG